MFFFDGFDGSDAEFFYDAIEKLAAADSDNPTKQQLWEADEMLGKMLASLHKRVPIGMRRARITLELNTLRRAVRSELERSVS